MSAPLDPTPPSPAAADDDYHPPPKEKRKELDFDITPMIDVVFLLLIFFMVSSTMQQSAPAEAPAGEATARGLRANDTIKVVLLPERGGEYEVQLPDGEIVPLDEALENDLITAAVAAAKEADPNKTEVVLLADRDSTAKQTFPILRQIGEVEGVNANNEVQDPR